MAGGLAARCLLAASAARRGHKLLVPRGGSKMMHNYGHQSPIISAPPMNRVSLAYKYFVGGGIWVLISIYPQWICYNVTRYKRISWGEEEMQWYDRIL